MFEGPKEKSAVASLVVARVVYAINWLNIGAIFYLMAPDLSSGLSGLGALSASFYLGVGLVQVPGGVLAARWGPKKVVMAGIMLSSVSTLGIAASVSLAEVAVLRFLAGAGMAFVFAPAVVLVARLFKGRRSGTGVGLFNSAFNVGGIFGLFVWIVIATETGWRPSLALSGAVGIVTALLVLKVVPDDEVKNGFRPDSTTLISILADRQLVSLGLGTLGLNVGNIMISNFMVYYLVNEFSLAGSLAGLISSIIVVVPIATALWGGRLYDRIKKPRRLMLLSDLGMGGAVLLLSLAPGVLAAMAAATIGGIVSGVGFTASFAAARDLNKAPSEYDGLAVAWVNSLSLTGSFWPPVLFSYLVLASGYPVAWLGIALICLAMLVPVSLLKEGVPVREE